MDSVLTNKVIEVVSNYYGVNPFTHYRGKNYCECRQAIWYCLRYKVDKPLGVSTIAQYFNRDHTTVCQGINRFNDLLSTEKQMRDKLDEIQYLLMCNLDEVKESVFGEKRGITVKHSKVFKRKTKLARKLSVV